jgi:hypothetical protein
VTQKGSTFASKIETTIILTNNNKIKNLNQKNSYQKKGDNNENTQKNHQHSIRGSNNNGCLRRPIPHPMN